MLETSENWEFFGFDTRLIGRRWRLAWRNFLWGTSSPVISRLDEVVRGYEGGTGQYFRAGQPLHVSDSGSVVCEAVIVPAEKILTKTLLMPVAVQSDLDAVMSLEVSAHSPFPAGDTVSGWTLVSKENEQLTIGLAIASASAIMTYLGQQYDCHDPKAYEIWACVDDTVIVIEGFGERRRRQRYRKRLLKTGALAVIASLLVVAIFGTAAVSKSVELDQYRQMSEDIQRDAAGASEVRTSLVTASETITAVNKFVASHPNPHREIARLTRLLSDEASIVSFDMIGINLRLRGRAVDAAAVMQKLIQEPAYAEVSTPQAITKLGNTGFEQFYLDIKLVQADTP